MANLSQEKREQMIAFLEKLKKLHSDDESLIAFNEIERELTSKKYGLIWELHEENVETMIKTKIPVFSEVQCKEITGDSKNNSCSFLLEGDNLHSLKLLEKTHKNSIDVIYIDPPYNTGNKDFIYDDTYVDNDDSYKHSKWLSFMSERLNILCKLLKTTGVIFISIGEQELASLKLLCDDIFGEQNYITIFSRQMKSGGAKGKFYTPNIDYVLTYAKDVQSLPNFKAILTQKQIDTFYNKTETEGPRKGEIYGEERLFKASLDARPNQRYYIKCPDGSYAIPPGETLPANIVEGETVLPKKTDKVWKWTYPRYKQELELGNIVFKKTKTSGLVDENGNQSKYNIYNKLWLSEQQDKGVVPSNFIGEYENRQSAAEMKKLGLDFTYAKPVNLIKYLITISNQNSNIVVLDCFAGSGTTGQAVLELNNEDGGHRSFILCTNNENSICENITYNRLKTVITGKKVDGTEYSEGISANLKYYKTDFVDKNMDDLSEELVKHMKEMIQLQYGVIVDNQKYVIIMDDNEMDQFEREFKKYSDLQAVFINQDVLLTTSQEEMLDMIDTFVIPDCYFDFELREAGDLW